MRMASHADGEPEIVPPLEERADFSVLDRVIGRQIKTSPFSDPILGLEIVAGPYKGVVFQYANFTMMPSRLDNGMVPTKYDVALLHVPEHLKAQNFTADDEGFDVFTKEILFAWLSYVHTNDLTPLIKVRPQGGIH